MILVFDVVSHRLFIEEDDYQPQAYEVIRSKPLPESVVKEIKLSLIRRKEVSDILQDIIDSAMKQAKQKRERDNYNLGNLIEDLEKYPSDAYVSIEPFSLYPIGFGSYRGYYEDLSIRYTTEHCNSNVLDCGKLLEKAKECVGKTFYGYKGGEFTMTKNSVIWLSNYGDATRVILTGVEDMFGDGRYLKLNWKIIE